jgi:hypothetical protein
LGNQAFFCIFIPTCINHIYYDKDEKQYYLRDDSWKGFKEFQYWPTYYQKDFDGEFETLEGERVSAVNRIKIGKIQVILKKTLTELHVY